MMKNFSIEKMPIKLIAIVAIAFLLVTGIVYLGMVNNIFIPDDPAFLSSKTHDATDPKITIDSSDTPYISWKQGRPAETVYVRRQGNRWVDAPGEIIPEPKSNGIFHVQRTEISSSCIDYDYENHRLEIQFEKEGKSQILRIQNNQDYIIAEAVMLDSNDNPHVVWIESLDENLHDVKLVYIRWNGEDWIYDDGQIFDPENKKYLQDTVMSRHNNLEIIIDAKDFPHIVYDGSFETEGMERYNVIYYIKWNGKKWVTADGKPIHQISMDSILLNDTRIGYVDFALDSRDYPHIVWDYDVFYDTQPYKARADKRVKYIRWDGKNWVTAGGKNYK